MDSVLIDGRRLEVRWFAPPAPDRPSILLLHEGLGSVALWRGFPQRLAERTGCGVAAYSRLGYGRSDALTEPRWVDYMHREALTVLPEVLRQLRIARPVLFGHSDGASIAIIFAGAHPDVPAGLILEAPHVFVEDHSIQGISRARDAFEMGDLPARLASYHDAPVSAFRGWYDVWLDPAFRSWNIEPYLQTIRCPVLVIQGDDDEYGTNAQVGAISAVVPDCCVLSLPACGHAPHREQERVTLDAVARFVERTAAGLTRTVPLDS